MEEVEDRQREAVLTVFLAWLITEKNVDLIQDRGAYREGIYPHQHPDLIREYISWLTRRNQSSS